MNSIRTAFFSDSTVDLFKSVEATVAASTAPFTADDVAGALIAANPNDQIAQDAHLTRGKVRRYITRALSNESSGECFICAALPDGSYVRHGVSIEQPEQPATQAAEPVLMSIREQGGRFYVDLLIGTERNPSNGFATEEEARAWDWLTRYPERIEVSLSELLAALKARLAARGTTSDAVARMWR